MSKFTGIALLLAVQPALTACDFFYGVDRSALVATMPDFDCVEHAIRQSPEVVDVQRIRDTSDGVELTYAGLHDIAPIHYFIYRGAADSGVKGAIQLQQNNQDSVTFGDNDMDINRKPPQREIDATRPVMLAIERRLVGQCGMEELPAHVIERCTGVECGPIP